MSGTRPEQDAELSPAERARVRRRDRRRLTSMVVDNAGIKRLAQALARRRWEQRPKQGRD